MFLGVWFSLERGSRKIQCCSLTPQVWCIPWVVPTNQRITYLVTTSIVYVPLHARYDWFYAPTSLLVLFWTGRPQHFLSGNHLENGFVLQFRTTTRCTDGEIFLARVHLPKSHTHPHHSSSFAKQQISMLRRHLITLIWLYWLVVWNIWITLFHPFCGLSSFPFFRTPWFFRGVGQPPTRHY